MGPKPTQSTPPSARPPGPARELTGLREPLTREQQALFDSCQGLVRSLAWRMQRKTGAMVELDDLIAHGQMGLVEAARKFDASRGLAFTTFAHYRIRGSILDGLEKLRWFSKAAFHGSRYEHLASDFLANETETESEGDGEWFVKMSRSLAVSYLISNEASAATAAMIEDESVPQPSAGVINDEVRGLLHKAIDSLPPQVAQLIRWSYFEGVTLKEAGERLGISKAWASRLHARALTLLASRLQSVGYEE